jgi:hypothetical protein
VVSLSRIVVPVFLVLLAAVAEPSETPDPLFQSDTTLDVSITAPLTSLIRERPKDDYLPGVFRFTDGNGRAFELNTEIRTRGNFRHETCDFPPLLLNFRSKELDGTLFENQNKMKLVVHCDNSRRHEQTILREYLAYRVLNAITNMSFKVRLLRVTYVDTDERRDDQVRYAFLIEHKNRLGARYELKDLEIAGTSVSSIQADRLNLTSIFEFFIGNTDFSPIAGAPDDECCHNYVLFGNDIDPIIAIPYDFDQSGIVDAPYAAPNENFRIRSVRQRLYRGRCVNNEYIETSLQKFRDGRAEIYALVETQEGLDSGDRKRVVRYIDDFYEIIDDPKDLEKRIIGRCI